MALNRVAYTTILVLFVRLFDLHLFGFVGFLFLLVSGKDCGLWLWHSLDLLLTFFFKNVVVPLFVPMRFLWYSSSLFVDQWYHPWCFFCHCFLPHLFFFLCIGKAVLRDCDFSCGFSRSFMRTEFLCVSVLIVASGPRVKLASCKSALNHPLPRWFTLLTVLSVSFCSCGFQSF